MADACQVAGCGRPQAAHRVMAHQFQADSDELRHQVRGMPKRVVAADAVLRMTLVKKGVLTYEELEETEK